MAIAIVQKDLLGTTVSTGATKALTSPVAGNSIIGVFWHYNATGATDTMSAPTDTQGNTWVVDGGPYRSGSNTNYNGTFYFAHVDSILTTGANTVTSTWSAAANGQLAYYYQVSGLNTAGCFDTATSGTATASTTCASGTISLNQATEFIVCGAIAGAGGVTLTPNGSFAKDTQPNGVWYDAVASEIGSDTSCTWSAGSNNWIVAIAAYKPTGGAAAALNPQRLMMLGVS